MQDNTIGSVRGGQNVLGFPTEDNIIAYFFLRDIGFQTRIKDYTEASLRIRRSLLTNHWNRKANCFQEGIANIMTSIRPVGVHLRPISWGALFALSINDLKRAYLCLRFIEANFKVGGALNY